MILSQITRSDVRFELLLCTSKAENLSPVGSVSQTVVSQSVGTIVVGISIGLSIGVGLSDGLSRPLAVVEAMMGVRVSVSSVGSVAQTMVTSVSSVAQSVVVGISISLSIGVGLSDGLSRPLAVVEAMMGIGVSGVSSVASIDSGVRIGTIAVTQPGVSLSISLRLGLWLTGDEGGKANHKSELHCCLS